MSTVPGPPPEPAAVLDAPVAVGSGDPSSDSSGHSRRTVVAGGVAVGAAAAWRLLTLDPATALAGAPAPSSSPLASFVGSTTRSSREASAVPASTTPKSSSTRTTSATSTSTSTTSTSTSSAARTNSGRPAKPYYRSHVVQNPGTSPAPPTPTTPTTPTPTPTPPPPVPGGFASVAAATRPTGVGPVDLSDPARNLLRKATWGIRPADLTRIRQLGIDAWLEEQLSPTLADPAGDQAWRAFPLAGASTAAVRGGSGMYTWDGMLQTVYGSMARQMFSSRQLFEIVADVFANLLNVPMPGEVWATGPDYQLNVIRRHSFGRFEDMLLAAMKHPAMLHYLNNDDSTREHVNENLGRELLELHTVGVGAGYSEEEVKSSARILSGRTVDWRTDIYRYDPNRHYVGPVSVLGFSHANSSATTGLEVGDAYLRHLARHPATAQRVALKLATRFVSDNPPSALVSRMASAYTAGGTAILPVLRAMFLSPEFWASAGQKVLRPHEDLIATVRVLDAQATDLPAAIAALYWTARQFGQPPLGWPAPNGYPDVAPAWLSAGSVLARWNTHRKVAYVWFKGLSSTRPDLMVPGMKSMTVAQFTDQMCVRLTGQVFPTKDRDALLGAAEIRSDVKIDWHDWQVGYTIVPLILDSIYFQVR